MYNSYSHIIDIRHTQYPNQTSLLPAAAFTSTFYRYRLIGVYSLIVLNSAAEMRAKKEFCASMESSHRGFILQLGSFILIF